MSTSAARPTPLAVALLAGSALATAALAVYQWLELLQVRAGGKTSCQLNDTVDCAAVWNGALARWVHDTLGVPVAGLGVVWGGGALLLAGLLGFRLARGGEVGFLLAALKLYALAGIASTVGLALGSVQARAVCLTCLGTYALVATFALSALLLVRPTLPSPDTLIPGAGWALSSVAAFFLAVLLPGQLTPRAEGSLLASQEDPEAFIRGLSGRQAEYVALARQVWKESPPRDVERFPTRFLEGSPEARVKVVDFTDIRCPHCRDLDRQLAELKKVAPKGSLSVEPRQFPIDANCNPAVPPPGGNTLRTDGVRCLAALVQICLEGHPSFWSVRSQLFAAQAELTNEKVLAIASQSGKSPKELEACAQSEEAAVKLVQDIKYALAHGIEGTPLVLINGKKTLGVPAFILGMALTGGDPDAPLFAGLPPPPANP